MDENHPYPGVCLQCGAITDDEPDYFCTDTCERDYYVAVALAHLAPVKTCIICGAQHTGNGACCSQDCYDLQHEENAYYAMVRSAERVA